MSNSSPEEQLAEIRKICFDIDKRIEIGELPWHGSIQWVTGQIMGAAKFGDGYPGPEGFPVTLSVGTIYPAEIKEIEIPASL